MDKRQKSRQTKRKKKKRQKRKKEKKKKRKKEKKEKKKRKNEYRAPGFFALQGRFTHPIIGSDVDQIQVRKLLGKIIESHPEFSLVPDANAEEFFVAVREGIPFPGTFAPGTLPFAFTPGITKSD